MNKDEAHKALDDSLQKYRSCRYSELTQKIGSIVTFAITVPSGNKYQIEIQFFWDGDEDGDIRVLGAVDDSGWRAFMPLTDCFIMSPDGNFVDEDVSIS